MTNRSPFISYVGSIMLWTRENYIFHDLSLMSTGARRFPLFFSFSLFFRLLFLSSLSLSLSLLFEEEKGEVKGKSMAEPNDFMFYKFFILPKFIGSFFISLFLENKNKIMGRKENNKKDEREKKKTKKGVEGKKN